jgi:predicted acetyltransferase
MEISVTPCSSVDELKGALGAIWHYFGGAPTSEDLERWSRLLDLPRMHAAKENGAIVGGAGAYTFEMTVPGGTVPAAGITVVGVLPTHRRHGILRAMMRAQLDDIHRRGEPVAYLWASEETIYGRFGYGMASLCAEIDLPRSANAFARPFESRGEMRILGEPEALAPIAQVYERVRRDHPGMFGRSEDWWKLRRLADPENRRQGGGPLNRAVLRIGGEPAGYALYRLHFSMEAGVSTSRVEVIEAIGATPEATRETWRFLLDIDWLARLRAYQLPVDHPLFFLLARPRSMRFVAGDALWVRIVDIPAALAARTMGPGEAVVLEVNDEFCPWNAGRYQVGDGRVERTTAAPDLALEVNELGSVYLGGFTFDQLARAERVRELREGAAARADALFPRDRAPWCPEIF